MDPVHDRRSRRLATANDLWYRGRVPATDHDAPLTISDADYDRMYRESKTDRERYPQLRGAVAR